MAGIIGNLIGTAIFLLPLGVALLLIKHRQHLAKLHKKAGHWGLVIAIALMGFAGIIFTYVGIGSWIVSALVWVRGMIGPAGPVVFAVAALFVLAKVVVGLFSQPDESAATVAFFAPMLFATFSVGLFASINATLAPMGQQVAAHIGQAIGA